MSESVNARVEPRRVQLAEQVGGRSGAFPRTSLSPIASLVTSTVTTPSAAAPASSPAARARALSGDLP